MGHRESKGIPEKHFCFIDYVKDFVVHKKLWKILKEMGIPDHLTYLLRNLYAGKEEIARTGHGTTNWFHVGLYEALTAIKIVGRNISNLRYADGTTLMAESEELKII